QHAQATDEVELLEHLAHAGAQVTQLASAQARHVDVADAHVARRDGREARDGRHAGRLAGSAGSEQRDRLTRVQVEVDAVEHEGLGLRVAHAQVADADARVGCAGHALVRAREGGGRHDHSRSEMSTSATAAMSTKAWNSWAPGSMIGSTPSGIASMYTPSSSRCSSENTTGSASRSAWRFSSLIDWLPSTDIEMGIEMLSPIERVSPSSKGNMGSPWPAIGGKVVEVQATSAWPSLSARKLWSWPPEKSSSKSSPAVRPASCSMWVGMKKPELEAGSANA